MKRDEIHIRDPFILAENGIYYLYGTRGSEAWGDHATGLDVYVSRNLEDWDGPQVAFTPPEEFWADRNFWAPEVHKYRGGYYMFVSFKNAEKCRGTQVLRADSPMGPFAVHSNGPVTPPDWEALDGTLYVDETGAPYLIFCHEWVQVEDGEMCVLPLTEDLKAAAGKPIVLFHASDPVWADKGAKRYVTDGPFLYRTKAGRLIMLWSSGHRGEYCEALCYSDSGSVYGPWVQDERLLFEKDGGHGMIFADSAGNLKLILHQPNITPNERPQIFDIAEQGNTLYRK